MTTFLYQNLMPVAALMLCAFFTLRHALHMYQLSSYQNPSYRKYLRENLGQLFGPRRIFILFFIPLLLFKVPNRFYPLLFVLVAALFVWLNRPRPAKKPLVYTSRVKRLIFTSYLIFLAAFSGYAMLCRLSIYALLGLPFLMCALVLLQPYLVMLAALINSPVERAVARHYINEARQKLAGMPQLTVVGITGSYGKTSTKYFLSELLSTRFDVYMTPGNFNTTLGVTRAVREGLRPTHEVFLCEMGARHVGDIREICQLVRPKYGVITSIGEQHLETFGSLENIVKTKLELYDAVRAGGTAFLNFDCGLLRQREYQGDVVSYGESLGCDYGASDVVINQSGSSFTVTAPDGDRQEFRTKLLGSANVQNLLAAIAVANRMGIPLKALVPAVRQLESVPHRLQLVQGGAFTIIDDAYNANPQGARVALDTLAMCEGYKVVVTPGMVELGERQEQLNEELGAHAAACCDFAVLVGEKQAGPLRRGLVSQGFDPGRIFVAKDIHEALNRVAAQDSGGRHKMVLLLNDLPDNYE